MMTINFVAAIWWKFSFLANNLNEYVSLEYITLFLTVVLNTIAKVAIKLSYVVICLYVYRGMLLLHRVQYGAVITRPIFSKFPHKGAP